MNTQPPRNGLVEYRKVGPYTIYRDFRSSATRQVVSTQQAWRVGVAGFGDDDRYNGGSELGYHTRLEDALKDIDEAHRMAHDERMEGTIGTLNRARYLAVVFPDAPNPPRAIARLESEATAEEARLESYRQSVSAKVRLNDAAPDMLEALREIAAQAEGYGQQSIAEKARAAIAKATGGA